VSSVKRVYDKPAAQDGARYLVHRLWPRGVKKEALRLEGWLKQVAPSDALRRWFAHDPKRWEEFRGRYFAELNANAAAWKPLLKAAGRGRVTLLFGARDEQHNNAVALQAYLRTKVQESKNQRVEGRKAKDEGRRAEDYDDH